MADKKDKPEAATTTEAAESYPAHMNMETAEKMFGAENAQAFLKDFARAHSGGRVQSTLNEGYDIKGLEMAAADSRNKRAVESFDRVKAVFRKYSGNK